MANCKWMEEFPNALIRHFHMEALDHCPNLIQTVIKENKVNHRFKFFQAWISNASSKHVVHNAWNADNLIGMRGHRLNHSLRLNLNILRKWNKEIFGFANIRIGDLENELENLQSNDQDGARQLQIQEELREQCAKLELISKEKSHEKWSREGGRNSKFVHMSTFVCWHNLIEVIQEDPNWLVEEEEITKYFTSKFEELFNSSNPSFFSDLENLLT